MKLNVQDPAADQAVVPAVIVIEPEFQELGLIRMEECDRLLANFRFDTPAAERAEGRAVGEHEHLGALLLRRAAARTDDRAQRDSFVALTVFADFIEEQLHEAIVAAVPL